MPLKNTVDNYQHLQTYNRVAIFIGD